MVMVMIMIMLMVMVVLVSKVSAAGCRGLVMLPPQKHAL